MKKLKKVFMSFGVFITGLISKVHAVDIDIVELKYGVFEPTIGEKISRIGKFAIPIILFVIGLFVILNKKITKKVKAIVISALVLLGILGYVFITFRKKLFSFSNLYFFISISY